MDVKNSNLTFMSKIVEQFVCRQLVAHLELHGLMLGLQSAYRRGHSTETAMLKVISDVLLAADSGQVSLLVLLDLSAAFDTVDHNILISRLHHAFGIQGLAQSWIESFIFKRTQAVSFAGNLSSVSLVTCGVPQGSVIGPVLFLLYTADVLVIVRRHSMTGHSYTDDTQV